MLDDEGRPTFRYSFAPDLRVGDYYLPVPAEPDAGFRRTLSLHTPKPVQNLWFRAAVGKTIARDDDDYLIDNAITMRFPRSDEVVIRATDTGMEVIVPVRFEDGSALIVQEIHW